MSNLSSRRIRAIADTAKFDGPTATATNAQLRMWNGSPTRFEWRFDYSGNLVTDLSNVTEMTMQIKSSADNRAPADDAAVLVSKTISSFDSTLDSGSWADGSKQHAAFTLTGAEANVGVGKCWIVLVASLSGIADPVTLCAGPLDVVGDGYDSGAGAPPSPAASYLNSSQSDARYLQLTGGTIAGNLTITGNTTLGDAAGDSATINAGTVSAPNATSLSADRLANVLTLDGRYGPLVVCRLTSDPTRNSTTMTEETSFRRVIDPGELWQVDARIRFGCDATSGIKFQFVSTGGLALRGHATVHNNTSRAVGITGHANEVAYMTGGTEGTLIASMTVKATGGASVNFGLLWATYTGTSVATLISESCVIYRRLA